MAAPNEGSDVKEKELVYPLTSVRGFKLPTPFLNVEGIERLMDFKPLDDDIFIVTYPKCGTTWTQFLVWEILNKGAVPPSPNQIMFYNVPFLEYADVDKLDHLTRPRAMKTHLPFHLQPYNPSAKYIYIVRNPYDCCVSYFYHNQFDTSLPDIPFNRYFDLFLQGEVGWGDLFDHVLSWFPHRNDPNVLFLSYEEMKKDVRKVLLKLAKFLGEAFYQNLQDEEVMENCVKHSDFKYLKELGLYFPENDGKDLNPSEAFDIMKLNADIDKRKGISEAFVEVNFFRKGETGDWKNHFSQSQLDRFNEYMKMKLQNTEMEGFWKAEISVEKETAH